MEDVNTEYPRKFQEVEVILVVSSDPKHRENPEKVAILFLVAFLTTTISMIIQLVFTVIIVLYSINYEIDFN